MNKKEIQLAATEGVFAFHTVKHSFSLRSVDCLSKLLKKVLDPGFASARTKTQAIVENVLAKDAKEDYLWS